jgi:hypothetical protein
MGTRAEGALMSVLGARAVASSHEPAALDRVVWLLILMVALFVLTASAWLTPSASGVGTHEQLGLPPCGMLAWLGIPCPACGLTTSFAHLAHGALFASLRAHPLGLPLFLLTCLAVPGALWALIRGLPVMVAIERLQADRAALYFVFVTLLLWLVRLA